MPVTVTFKYAVGDRVRVLNGRTVSFGEVRALSVVGLNGHFYDVRVGKGADCYNLNSVHETRLRLLKRRKKL